MQCLSGKHPQPPTLDHAACAECAAETQPQSWQERELEARDPTAGYECERTVNVWFVIGLSLGAAYVLLAALAAWGAE